MGATYTRQSSSGVTDGAVIEASDLNNEFDQLLAAFAVSSGHTHDGTAAEGGPITKLLGTALTIGDGTAGTDIAVTFDGETADGVLTWMEDEDYFKFSDDVLMNSTEKLLFGDTGTYIHQSADGVLDLVSDTEIEINATTIDINGNVDVSGTLTVAGAVDFGDAALSNVGAVQLDSIAGDGDTNTSITFSGSDVITVATGGSGRLTIGDGALSPVTNNQIDLGTTSLEFKDAFFDGTVTADAFAGPLTGNVTGNASGTAATVTTAAQSNITSLGTLTTLTVDNVIINGSTIGHTGDIDLLTVASGILTVAGEVSATTLDIGGTNITSTATEINLLDGVAGLVQADLTKLAALDATAAEINLIDGGTSTGSITLADADGFIVNDGGTTKLIPATDIKTYIGSSTAADDITAGDAAISLATSSGAITVDSNASTVTVDGHTGVTIQSTNSGNITLDSIAAINIEPATGSAILLDGTISIDAGVVTGATSITSTAFVGALTGNVTGNTSGTAATVTTAAQSNITSLGTLTTLTVDDIITNGATIGHTSDTDLLTLGSALLTVAGAVTISGITSFPDGTAGAPSITNTGDTNTGLLFSAADTLSFSAGGTAQFTMADGAISPVTDNDIDLGTSSLEFKNVYVDGTTFTDALGFGTVVMTLPTADGSANQILTTNGSGALAFVDNSGGTDWQAVKTANFTAAAGQGVFANTTSSAWTVTLPAGSIGDEVSVIDYAGTFDTNNLTVTANGSEKIHASTDDLTVSVERAAFTLVFTDSTQGWLLKDK